MVQEDDWADLVTEGVALVSFHASGEAHPQPSEPQADGAAEAKAALGVSLAGLRVATHRDTRRL